MREIWARISRTGGTQVYTLLTGMVLLSLTARLLGPEGRGVYATVLTWTSLFATLGALSLGQVVANRAAGSPGLTWLPRVMGSLVRLFLGISALTTVVAVVLWFATGGEIYGKLSVSVLLFGLPLIPLAIWDQYSSHLAMAAERLSVYNRSKIIGQTLALVLVPVALVGLDMGVAGVLGAWLLGQVAASLYTSGKLYDLAERRLVADREESRALLSGGLQLHVTAIGTMLFAGTDVVMVNFFRGAEETGFYQLAVRLWNVMLMLPVAASMVLYGRVSAAGPDGAWPQQRKLIWQVVGLIAAGSVLAWLLAPWGVRLIAGAEFEPSIGIFRLLLLALFGHTVSKLMASQWVGRGLFWQSSALTLFCGAVNLLANWLLIPRYGMVGAAWATVGTSTLLIAINTAFALRLGRGGVRS